MNDAVLKKGMDYFVSQVDRLVSDMNGKIPGSQTENYVYLANGGEQWTDGFWCGMLNLCYEYTGDEKYKTEALKQIDILYDRILNKRAVNHHDMGFLYSPSCIAGYYLYKSEKALKAATLAADNLLKRFRTRGEFIQAWGNIDDTPESYRLIIDCLINLPLLYRISEITGDLKYREVAEKHFKTAVKCVIRKDFSTNHTQFFDINTGLPTRASTVQGYSDDSMWARGQSWGVYGLALNYRYLRDDNIVKSFNGVTNAFLKQLPKDNIPYWDMIFTSGDEPRDSSAASISVCGILEMNKYFPNELYTKKAEEILNSLISDRTTKDIAGATGLVKDSMYNRNAGHKPESSIWGDYYAMEAVFRSLNPEWRIYW